MSLISTDNDKAQRLYIDLLDRIPNENCKDISLIVVQHLVQNTIPFIKALTGKFKKIALIPKPNSINMAVLDFFTEHHDNDEKLRIIHARRFQTSDYKYYLEKIGPYFKDDKFAILDIGGYFSDSFSDINKASGGKLIGVVEDTENGHQKYSDALRCLNTEELRQSIFSVARSPLKSQKIFWSGNL